MKRTMSQQMSEQIPTIPTLETLCYDKIAQSMENAPYELQQTIIGETRRRMEYRILFDIKQQYLHTLPRLVSKILEFRTRSTNNTLDGFELYSELLTDVHDSLAMCPANLSPESVNNLVSDIIQCASNISDNFLQSEDSRDYEYDY